MNRNVLTVDTLTELPQRCDLSRVESVDPSPSHGRIESGFFVLRNGDGRSAFSESYLDRVQNGQIPPSGSLSSGSAYCFHSRLPESVKSDIGMHRHSVAGQHAGRRLRSAVYPNSCHPGHYHLVSCDGSAPDICREQGALCSE